MTSLEALLAARLAAQLGDPATAAALARTLLEIGLTWRAPTVAPEAIRTIIAFTFGNRMAPSGNRTPGPVNQALADLALRLHEATGANDCYGTLTYEPYWNQPGSVGAVGSVPLDQWVDVSIDADSGVFWWSGGFGQPNSFGGPPLLTLNDWVGEFSDDFPGSTLLLVSIGVGSFNQGQIGYFDDVEIVHDDYQAAYDFEPAIGPPEDKDACKNGGWMTFNNPSFRNQGDCVSFVVSNGKAKRQS
jgi:hypothetical protein